MKASWVRYPGETLLDTQWELNDQLWFLPYKSSRMWLTIYWGCFIPCVSLPSSADLFLHNVSSATLTAAVAGTGLQDLLSWRHWCCLCSSHIFVPAPLGHRSDPHIQTVPLDAIVSHLSMLMAQRFRMLAVHIITSMVTKMSQQIRLNVQTPPVTCTSDTKPSALLCTRSWQVMCKELVSSNYLSSWRSS